MTIAIEHVLDAALDDDVFVDLMRLYAAKIGAKGFAAGWASGPAVENMFAFDNDWSPSMIADYHANHAHRDPWTLASLADPTYDAFVKMSDLVRPAQYEASLLWNELLKPGGDDSYFAVGMKTKLAGGMGGLTFYRGPSGDFSSSKLTGLARDQAVLSKLLKIKATIAHGAAQARNWRTLADRFAGEVFVVDISSRLVDCNAAGERRLLASDGLTLRVGCLTPTRASERQRLDAAVSLAVTGDGLTHFAITDRDGHSHPYQVLRVSGPAEPVRLMLLGQLPQFVSAELASRLLSLYQLTSAEADVIVALANGTTVEDVAAKRGSRYETVRTQYRAALVKMGCRRISDAAIELRRMVPLDG